MKGYMRIFLSALIITILSLQVLHAQEGQVINFAPKWSVGEVVHYSIEQQSTPHNSYTRISKANITITVVDKTDTNYTFEWRYDSVDDLDPDNILSDPQVQEIMYLTKGLVIRYTTNNEGSFEKVINAEEIKAYLKSSSKVLQKTIHNETKRKTFAAFVDGLANNVQFINHFFAKDISLFHNSYLYGKKYVAGEMYIDETVVGNPFDPRQPFTAKLQTRGLASSTLQRLEIDRVLDKEKSAKILMTAVDKLAKNASGQQTSGAQKIKSIEIKERFQYSFQNKSNWLKECSYIQTLAIDNNEWVESIVIKQNK